MSISANDDAEKKFCYTTGAHVGLAGDQDSDLCARESKPNEDLIKSLFYLRNEETGREVYASTHGKVLHKAMRY